MMGPRIIGGTVVFLTLIIVADIEPLSQLAVAFAYLILFSAIWGVGPVAFARISSMVGSGNAINPKASYQGTHGAGQ